MTKEQEALKLALEAYLCREMPAGTIIGDPKWWAPKIAAAIKEALSQPDYRAVKTYHEGKPVYVSQTEQEPVGEVIAVDGDAFQVGFIKALPVGTKLYITPPAAQPPEPRNFCPRCGKRTADLTVIHTCTPPRGLEMT